MSGKVGFIMGRTKKEMDLLAASAAKKKRKGKIEFLYILPFILLVAVFSYYPLWGWVYAFFDYKPPFPLEWKNFVGLKWFKSMFENEVKINELLRLDAG